MWFAAAIENGAPWFTARIAPSIPVYPTSIAPLVSAFNVSPDFVTFTFSPKAL